MKRQKKVSDKTSCERVNCEKQRNKKDYVRNRLPSNKKGGPGALTEGFPSKI